MTEDTGLNLRELIVILLSLCPRQGPLCLGGKENQWSHKPVESARGGLAKQPHLVLYGAIWCLGETQ